MPKYSYRCSGCDKEFELYHSMFESIERCILCEAEEVKRVPYLNFSVANSKKSGDIVKEFINDVKVDVEKEKKKLREEYDG